MDFTSLLYFLITDYSNPKLHKLTEIWLIAVKVCGFTQFFFVKAEKKNTF